MTRRIDKRVIATTTNEPSLLNRILENRNLPLLLRDTDVAALINISPSSLRKMRSEGKSSGRSLLPQHVYVGVRVRYRLSDLVTWIESLTGESNFADRGATA